ncbi:class II glutamine amidotransferase [Granulosicoccaceae sp. 1_MG-2023]|nr:class II glutamine amidotransferase [Granulosicoccaceae sp. 1_MG-2023]
MCELLGMSANVPTDICFSFSELMRRGGGTGPHRDGWGIAFYENAGCRSFHDPNPSYESPMADFVRDYPIKSDVVIGHIRHANVGRVSLENTQPYIRELWGRYWCFAHNGQMEEIFDTLPMHGRFCPVGSTDSEYAFCWLLNCMQASFNSLPDEKDIETLGQFLLQRALQLHHMGVYNMLLSNSQYLFAFCSTKLWWITRKAPFGEAQLRDADMTIDFKNETTPDDIVTVIATEPLTCNETWHSIAPGQLCVFRDGKLLMTLGEALPAAG